MENPKLRTLIIRRNADDLKDWIDRAFQKFSLMGVTKSGNPPEFRVPCVPCGGTGKVKNQVCVACSGSKVGAILRTGHLNDEQAYTKYQGHEYQRILIEEINQIKTEEMYLRLVASCRSTVAETTYYGKTYTRIKPKVFATTNPGNVGHAWVRARFVSPAEPNTVFIDPETGLDRIFIPSSIDDNPTLIENDPNYVKQLDALKKTNEALYRAWRFGDWDVFAGQAFREFKRETHVIDKIIPKEEFTHLLSIDWGYGEKSAFAAYLNAIIPCSIDGEKFNRVVTYWEWYGNLRSPDDWAEIIYRDCVNMGVRPRYGYTDPAMHNTQTDGSVSIADIMQKKWKKLSKKNWCILKRGTSSNGRNSRVAGVATVHNWLAMGPNKIPYWVVTENCLNLIRTLPMLVYDDHNPDDINSDSDDHAFDSCKYLLGNVKYLPVKSGGVTNVIYSGERGVKMLDGSRGINLDKFKVIPRKLKKYFA